MVRASFLGTPSRRTFAEMDSELLELLTQPVTVEPFVSEDQYGNHTYGPGVPLEVRIDDTTFEGTGKEHTQDGDPESATYKIIAEPHAAWKRYSRVTTTAGVLFVQTYKLYYDENPTTPYYVEVTAKEGPQP
jgi:hypothetical protein